MAKRVIESVSNRWTSTDRTPYGAFELRHVRTFETVEFDFAPGKLYVEETHRANNVIWSSAQYPLNDWARARMAAPERGER